MSLKIAIRFLINLTYSRWLPRLFIVEKELFLRGLLQMLGQSSVFIYGLSFAHLYIQSCGVSDEQ